MSRHLINIMIDLLHRLGYADFTQSPENANSWVKRKFILGIRFQLKVLARALSSSKPKRSSQDKNKKKNVKQTLGLFSSYRLKIN